jgi:mannitol/fructose-specific phosphotransferase system IIA component (Ntr-type)
MKALLNALQEGRLVELPDNIKSDALEFLGTLLEAVPEVSGEEGVTEKALKRESLHNTGIGMGWACPHATTEHEGELLSAVGWSPQGIDYGAPDGKPVHLMVMYFVPDSQRNAYLKEISLLAKAIHQNADLQKLQELTELSDVRHALLDAITHAIESVTPEARARMIQLEVRHAEAAAEAEAGVTEIPGAVAGMIFPVSVLVSADAAPIVLGQNAELVAEIEQITDLAAEFSKQGRASKEKLHVVLRSSEHYAKERILHSCIAYRSA